MATKPKTKMPISQRAKQFIPFSALEGLAEALAKKEKQISAKMERSKERAAELNQVLKSLEKGMVVTVKYFDGGEYLKTSGKITLIDDTERILQLEDLKIYFDDISDLDLAKT